VSLAERDYLSALARARGVHMCIRENVPDQELATLYSKASVFVYAPVREPFGLAPIEAMACGTPVVAVAEGGPLETVRDGETGYLVPREPRLFGDAVARLLSDEALCAQLGEAGVSSAREFWTWPAAYDRFRGLVEAYLGGAVSSRPRH
jgi:glycosyltransferase involved in cell wall biosynthesis